MILSTLVGTEVFAAHLGRPDWIVFDCRHDLADPTRGERDYAEGHIPGARFLHLERDLSGPKTGANGRHPLPERAWLAARLAAAGVDSSKQVIAYDAQGGMNAARLWWLLRWLGHWPVAVLDGGWQRWVAERRPTSTQAPLPAPADFHPGTPLAEVAEAGEILARLGDPQLVLLDARAPERWRGEVEPLDPVAGRIPGARNRCYRDNLDTHGGFKPAELLAREFGALIDGASPQRVVNYCGSGVSACHNLLAMEHAGLRGARLYPGSWSEWCADPARPVERGGPGDAPSAR